VEDEDDADDDDESGPPTPTRATPSPPPPAVATEPFPGEPGSDAAVPAKAMIPAGRRRPTNRSNVQLDEDGNLVVPEDPKPEDLKTQLSRFLAERGASAQLDALLEVAAQHGLVALNSELLAKLGADLKGNTVGGAGGPGDQAHHDPKAFGVGDSKLIEEMVTHRELKHSDDAAGVKIQSSGVCNKFRLDTASPEFGVCKCGHRREKHVVKRSSLASASLQRKLDEKRLAAEGLTAVAAASVSSSPASRVGGATKPGGVEEVPVPVPVAARTAAASHPATPTAAPGGAPPHAPPPGRPPRPPENSAVVRASGKRSSKPTSGKKALERLPDSVTVKAPHACTLEQFKLDLGKEFGTCAHCGWKKADHAPGSAPSAPASLGGAPPPSAAPSKAGASGGPCAHYKLDIGASTFGVCVCGYPRQAHQGQASNAHKVHGTLERKWNQMRTVRVSVGRGGVAVGP